MRDRTMKRVLAGMMAIVSISIYACEESERYERLLKRKHPYIEKAGKRYELEYEVRDLENFILLEIEIEEDFFSRKVDFTLKAEGAARRAAMDIRSLSQKRVRAVVHYEGENIFTEKY